MGCDFYIRTYLEIHHNNGISYYELPTIRGYYCDLECRVCDSDIEDEDDCENFYNSTEFKSLYENMKKFCLTPRKPIDIYSNNSFITPKLEAKYLPMIQNKINKIYSETNCIHEDTGIFTKIEEIIKIVKKEERYDSLEYF